MRHSFALLLGVAACGNQSIGSMSQSVGMSLDGGDQQPDPCAGITCPGTQECENGHCYDALPVGSKACGDAQSAHVGDECCTAADCCGEAGGALACDPATYTCRHPPATTTTITCGDSQYTCPVYWAGGNDGASVWIGGACSLDAAGDLGGSGCPEGGGAYCVFDCQGCCVAIGATCQLGAGGDNPCCDGGNCVNGTCQQCPLAGEYCGDGQGCCPGLGLECDGDENHSTYDTCVPTASPTPSPTNEPEPSNPPDAGAG
jgi:hypothetical protein